MQCLINVGETFIIFFSCAPNCIHLLVHFNAACLLCGAFISTWVVLVQIVHCCYARSGSGSGVFSSSTTFFDGELQTR